jgi:hypothetical protein
MVAKFFITHSSHDVDFARRLTDDLRAHGLEGFFDVYAIQPGDDIVARINKGLAECDVFVPILSFAALKSPWCDEEINAAIMLGKRPWRNGRPRIIPILIDDCVEAMPPLLQHRLYVNFVGNYDMALNELLERGFEIDRAEIERLALKKAEAESLDRGKGRLANPASTGVKPLLSVANVIQSRLVWVVSIVALLLVAISVVRFDLPLQPLSSPSEVFVAAMIPTSTKVLPTLTVTPTPSSVPTVAPPTSMPSPTLTATPTIVTNTPRIPTVTRSPLPTVRPEPFVFPDPIVIRPMDKAKFTLNDPIILQWKPVEGLREDDLYLVQVDLDGNYNAKTLVCEKYTKETQVILTGDFCSSRLTFNSRYFWRVTVVWLDANGIRLARGHWPPQTREFAWQP